MKKTENTGGQLLFAKTNYQLMIGGIILIALGMFLMAGKEDIFSSTKITVGPILAMLGFVLEVFAIMYRPKKK
jgi:uncharacterized membrane protein